jgi:hypothetical protein
MGPSVGTLGRSLPVQVTPNARRSINCAAMPADGAPGAPRPLSVPRAMERMDALCTKEFSFEAC